MRTFDAAARTQSGSTLSTLFDDASIGPWTVAILAFPWRRLRPPATPLSDEILRLVRHRLATRALAYIRAVRAEVNDIELRLLRRGDFESRQLTLAANAAGAAALRVLGDAAVSTLVVKGPGIASTYSNPTWRSYSDIDLLVEPNQFRVALGHLQRAGWSVDTHYPRPWFPHHCVEGVNMTRDGGERIDLHHHVPPWLWGDQLDFASLWQRGVATRLHDETGRTLSTIDHLLVATLHVVSDRSAPGHSLSVWQDIVELSLAVDPGSMWKRAQDCRLDGWLFAVLAALPDELDAHAARMAPADRTLLHRHRLRLLLARDTLQRRPSLEWLARLPTSRALPLLAGVLFPDRATRVAAGAPTYRDWWRRLRTGHAITFD